MMKDKYRLEETSHSLKIQPHYYLFQAGFRWYVAILVMVLLCLPIAQRYWRENGLIIDCIMGGLMLFYAIRDYFFKINVRYVFDKSTNTIYKTNLPFVNNKKLMNFDEMTIFTHSETGSWNYEMGIKKKQFLKSYCISEPFGSGKKSKRRQEEYENEILKKILEITSNETGL